MIIGLGYKARSGKDTVGDHLFKYGFQQDSFANVLRKSILFTLEIAIQTPEQKNATYPMWGNRTGREILQQFGTDALRNNFDQDIWVKRALYLPDPNPNGDAIPKYAIFDRVVFTDMRFTNEAEEIKKLGGIVIRIDRDEKGLNGKEAMHQSETELDDYTEWDYILDNNGSLERLFEGVDTIMNELDIKKRHV